MQYHRFYKACLVSDESVCVFSSAASVQCYSSDPSHEASPAEHWYRRTQPHPPADARGRSWYCYSLTQSIILHI